MIVETHRFTAYSFRQFNLAAVSQVLNVAPTKTLLKDTIARLRTDRIGGAFGYQFGVLCLWNYDATEGKELLEVLERTDEGLTRTIESDDYLVEVVPDTKPRVEFNKLVLDQMDSKRAEVIALTLAQSVTMSNYEQIVEQISVSVAKLVKNLKKSGGRIHPTPRRFHSIIADSVNARNSVIGILHLLDRPDIIWDDAVMDSLYSDLRSSFDLEERFRAIEYKLGAIQDTMELLIDMARDSRLFLAETGIILLILVEILLTVFYR